jgi:hypothetical protein
MARRSPSAGAFLFDPKYGSRMGVCAPCRRADKPISDSFYLRTICEKSVISNRLIKKFCEIAAVLVSPA